MTDRETAGQRALEITVYGVVLQVLLDNVDAVMDAEPEEDMPENLLALLSLRNQPFMIHAVLDNYILSKLGKEFGAPVSANEILSIAEENDPYFGTLLAAAAGSDIITHPDPSATPFSNARVSVVKVEAPS
ncbi:hypothetical protein [Acetobacter cerevisiae]|uniref:Uncharacterized protein n=1 Tax=Acetobacter cerevisiae TaxID=178900 RepID=A0A149UR43_9PROT|nr:hypothetical protein [Acetobacter cerevisiae]KXV70460.1 hypothetical protein AD952_12835 [Acetobacter cerevisiae]MCP1271977.1 hypothetical protein [Acetobacter cerevisiae]MCP1279932.1 hypothetical protein [Acetobacter cerevisiae]